MLQHTCRLVSVLLFGLGFVVLEPAEAEAGGLLRRVRSRTQGSGEISRPPRTAPRAKSSVGRDPSVQQRRAREQQAARSAYIAGYGVGAGALLYGPYGYGYSHIRPVGVFGPSLRSELEEEVESSLPPWRLQLGVSRGQASEGGSTVDRYRLDLRVQTPWPVDASATGFLLVEPLDGRPDDRLALWKGTAWWRAVDERRVELALGAGYRRLFDPANGENGGHVSGSLRFFPLSSFVLEGRLDAGWIGEATHFDWRTSAGALFGPVEIYFAWTGLTFDDLALTGPSVGMRLWL